MTTSTTFVTYISSQNIKRLIIIIMKKTIKEARAELLVDTLDIQNEMLKSIVTEMLSSSNSYEYERLEGLLLGVEPFIEPNNVSLEIIK